MFDSKKNLIIIGGLLILISSLVYIFMKNNNSKVSNTNNGVESELDKLTNEEISKIINDAQKHKEEDEYFRKITNMHDLLYDCEIQIEELLRTNVLNKDDNNDLLDLKYSLKQDGKSQNIELLSSLLESAKETIKEKSFNVHEAAK